MALLVPAIGEEESLRYLIGANNHVLDLAATNPRNLILKLYSSNTNPADADVPSRNAYFEPYAGGATASLSCGYGTLPVTGYPLVSNARTDANQDFSNAYGILLNGSRWQIVKSGTGGTTVTATYPEQTFTFTGSTGSNTNAGNIYGYYLTRAHNLPLGLLGVTDAATVAIGTAINKGNDSYPTIGIVGNTYFTVDSTINLNDVTTGMGVTHLALGGQTVGIASTARVVGVDRSTNRVYLDSPLLANIQVATGSTVRFVYSKVSTGSSAHRLNPGDVIYIAPNATNTASPVGQGCTSVANTYTVFSVPNANEFYTTPSLHGAGSATLLNSIFYAERFTNGPYNIQNPGDEIKVTLNVSLE
jgi:hypothetical protein